MKLSGTSSLTGLPDPNKAAYLQQDYSWGANRVGYSPGQVGPVPPDIAQWSFQNAQYERMYGALDRWRFGHAPIPIAIAWSFPLAFMMIGFFRAAVSLTPEYANWANFDWLFLVVIWAVTAFVCLYLPFHLWVGALALHRRKYGDRGRISRKLAWFDPIINDPRNKPRLDRDYPLDPSLTERDFYPYR